MPATLQGSARRIATLAWPVFIGQLAVLAFSTIDTVMVARYGALDLAALAIGTAAYVTVFVGLMGVVLAIAPITGQLFGAGKLVECGRQLHQGLWLALALSVIGDALLLFPQPFLSLSHAEPEVAAKVRGYLSALAWALPPALLFTAFRGFNIAVSRPKIVMLLQLAALVLKVPLTALLVFGFTLPTPIGEWRLNALGTPGCGVATAIVMTLQMMAAWVLLQRDMFYTRFSLTRRSEAPVQPRSAGDSPSGLLGTTAQGLRCGLSRRSEAPVQPHRAGDSPSDLLGTTAQGLRCGPGHRFSPPDRSAIIALLRLGVPMGLSIAIEVTGFTSMAFFIARIGATPVAAHQIALNLVSMLFMIPLAIGNAAGTLVAQRVGAGDPTDARRLGWHALELGVLIAASVGAAVYLAREPILNLYTHDTAVIAAALPLLAWMVPFHIADAAQTVAAFVLRAYRVATAPMVIYAVAIWGIGLGGGYVVAFNITGLSPMWLRGSQGFWSAATLGLMIAGLSLSGFLAWVLREQARPHALT